MPLNFGKHLLHSLASHPQILIRNSIRMEVCKLAKRGPTVCASWTEGLWDGWTGSVASRVQTGNRNGVPPLQASQRLAPLKCLALYPRPRSLFTSYALHAVRMLTTAIFADSELSSLTALASWLSSKYLGLLLSSITNWRQANRYLQGKISSCPRS